MNMRSLGRYQVHEAVVGQGRTGRVFRGERTDDGAAVAVRQVPPRLLSDPEIRKVLKNLPFSCFGLRSPCIVPVLDTFDISGSFAVVEPWIDGPPLSRGKGHGGQQITRSDVARQLVELGDGLQELHDRGVVHGDVRADNIFLTAEGPKLVGLGVAAGLQRRIRASRGLGSTGASELGDAPELTGSPPTVTTDLYGLAAAYRIVLRTSGVLAGDPLVKAVDKAVKLDPSLRFEDLQEFLDVVRGELDALSAVDAVADYGGTTRVDRAQTDGVDLDIATASQVDDVSPQLPSSSEAEGFPGFSEPLPDGPLLPGGGGEELGLGSAVPLGDSEPPPAPRGSLSPPPPGPGPIGGPAVGTLSLGLADPSLEADEGPVGLGFAEEDAPDDVTTVERQRAGPSETPKTTLADYTWLFVGAGFALLLVVLWFGVGFIRGLLPDVPDGMIAVSAGDVQVGAQQGPPPEAPGFVFSHQRFFIDRAEVTFARYELCVAEGECTAATGRLKRATKPNEPATGVSWLQAHSYCSWSGKRLPTENEWEAAALVLRSGSETPDCHQAVYSRREGAPCSRGNEAGPRAASEDEGAVDLLGNVWEFVDSDWSEERSAGTGDASPVGGTVLKVIKGGGWSSDVSQIRAAARLPVQNIYWAADVGFRCAGDPER